MLVNLNKSIYPPLRLLSIASVIQEHDLKLSDINISDIQKDLKNFIPDILLISFSTTNFTKMQEISYLGKQINKDMLIVLEGKHAMTEIHNSLQGSKADIIINGDGEFVMPHIVSGNLDAPGIALKDRENKMIIVNKDHEKAELGSVPYPLWSIVNINKYNIPSVLKKNSPIGLIETHREDRKKTPKEITKEFEHLIQRGFKEIHIKNNQPISATYLKEITKELEENKITIPWAVMSHVKVDNDFSGIGAYRLTLDIVSGNQQIISSFGNGLSLERAKMAVMDMKNNNIQPIVHFSIGFPYENEEITKESFEFVKNLDPYLAKLSLIHPLPGTEIYSHFEKRGLIKTRDWSKYSNPSEIYSHPNLTHDKIKEHYDFFYNFFYSGKSIDSKSMEAIKNM